MHGGSQGEPTLSRALVGHARGALLVALTHANSTSRSSSKNRLLAAFTTKRIPSSFAVASRDCYCSSKSTQSPSWLPRQEAQTTKARIVNIRPPITTTATKSTRATTLQASARSETDRDRAKTTNNTSLVGPCPPTANCICMTPRFFSRAPPPKGDSKSHRRKHVVGELRTL